MTNADKLFLSSYIVKRAQPYIPPAVAADNETGANRRLSPLEVLNKFMPKGYEFGQDKKETIAQPSDVPTSAVTTEAKTTVEPENQAPLVSAPAPTPEKQTPPAPTPKPSKFKPKLPDQFYKDVSRAPAPNISDPNRATNREDVTQPYLSVDDYIKYYYYVPDFREGIDGEVSDFAPSPTKNSLNAVSLTPKDPSQFFKSYMGSNFDPKSRVDRNKLKFLQSLQSEGMNLENVKNNQAAVYKRMKGMRF
jgi:hypothetical protein